MQWDDFQLRVIGGTDTTSVDVFPDRKMALGNQRQLIEYGPGEIEWLQAKDPVELRRLGLCFRPFTKEWLIRRGGIAVFSTLPCLWHSPKRHQVQVGGRLISANLALQTGSDATILAFTRTSLPRGLQRKYAHKSL